MTTEPPAQSKLAIIIQQGKVLDFIDGKTQRQETPEEYVRQGIAKSLVREYRYEKANIQVEFVVRVGTRKPRADPVIFPPSTEHKQENALIIVECKAFTVKAAGKKDGVGQLQSYMAPEPPRRGQSEGNRRAKKRIGGHKSAIVYPPGSFPQPVARILSSFQQHPVNSRESVRTSNCSR